MEKWKEVPGGFLEVSDLGNVRTLSRLCSYSVDGVPRTQRRPSKLLSPWIARNGYLHVSLKDDTGRRNKLLVHRLVAGAFVSGWFDGATVNHIDGNKLNNLPGNLEWVTLAENSRKQWTDGLVNLRGQRHPSAKLTDAQSLEILRRSSESPTTLAREFGVSASLIYKIRQGRKKAWLTPPTA